MTQSETTVDVVDFEPGRWGNPADPMHLSDSVIGALTMLGINAPAPRRPRSISPTPGSPTPRSLRWKPPVPPSPRMQRPAVLGCAASPHPIY